jgi:acetyl esterase/lipase
VSRRRSQAISVLRRLGPRLLLVSICIAGVLALYANRKPILIWASGHRYRPRIPAQIQIFRDIEQGAMDQVSRGYALASVDYSLSFEEKWPAQLQKVRAAMRWLGTNAATYGLNPTETVVWGMSAGGHLASVVGTSADLETGDRPYRIRAVVAWCAPSDLAALSDGAYASVRQLLGYDPKEDSGKEIPANPVRYISPGDPPFYILHGSKDTVVPVAHAIKLKNELEKAGIPVTFRELDQYVHEDIRFNSAECMPDLERFLDRLCLGKAGSQ